MLTKLIALTIVFGQSYNWHPLVYGVVITAEIILGILLYIPLLAIAACVCALFK